MLALFTAAKAEGAPVAFLEQLKAIGLTKPIAPAGEPSDDVQREMNPADYGDATPEQATAFVTDEVHDAEIVDDDLTEIWFLIMAAAGGRGWTTADTEQRFAREHDGLMPATASPTQLRKFLAAVKAGEIQ